MRVGWEWVAVGGRVYGVCWTIEGRGTFQIQAALCSTEMVAEEIFEHQKMMIFF